MADTTHDAPAGEDSSGPRSEESRTIEASGLSTARLLANPRRVRRA